MKTIQLCVAACLAACVCASAYAQTAPGTNAAGQQNATGAMPVSAQFSGTQPTLPITRAEVYQELIQAEQDGQLAYLNSTVFIH
jgi:hypothetical protein